MCVGAWMRTRAAQQNTDTEHEGWGLADHTRGPMAPDGHPPPFVRAAERGPGAYEKVGGGAASMQLGHLAIRENTSAGGHRSTLWMSITTIERAWFFFSTELEAYTFAHFGNKTIQ